ncbi:MAG: adenylate/guanylate cyclase domain-containing protein [Chitinivorax sp.]
MLLPVFLLALAGLLAPGWTQGLDEFAGDLGWRLAASRQPERRVVLIDIDEASLRELGPWPWPRGQVAELARRLEDYGARKQIYDIVFETPRAGDVQLAEALLTSRASVAQIFVLDRGVAVKSGNPVGALAGEKCPPGLPQAAGYIAPSASLAVSSVGHITPRIDKDGAVRRLPLLVCLGQQVYPALALAGLLDSRASVPRLQAGVGLLDPAQFLAFGPHGQIPLSASADVRVPYDIAPENLVAISAADVMAGRVPARLLQGKTVLVGSTALGVNDAVPTPFNGATAGMLIHAELYVGLLDGRIPYTPRGVLLLQAVLFVAGGCGLLLVAGRARRANVFLPLLGVLGAFLVFALHIALLLLARLWLGWAAVALALLLAALLLAIYEHWRSRSERERLFSHLSSYLPAAVASALALQRPSGAVQAERREVTVLIADIRNFSAYCENAPAEEVAAVLHAYITIAQQVVEEYGGVLEAMHGDSLLALWPRLDSRALDAADKLIKQADRFLPAVLPENLAPLALGVGIESGPALIGSIGPQRRRTHTAMGATVTTASRLQAMTSDLAENILLGPLFAQALPEDRLRGLGQFLLEGMRRPQNVFAPDH